MVKSTIDDVAALAGVSIKTVSRVVNKEPNIRKSTQEKVEAAIEQLSYQPNHSARSLAGSRSFLVGLLYSNPSSSYIIHAQTGSLATLYCRLRLCPAGNANLAGIDNDQATYPGNDR